MFFLLEEGAALTALGTRAACFAAVRLAAAAALLDGAGSRIRKREIDGNL